MRVSVCVMLEIECGACTHLLFLGDGIEDDEIPIEIAVEPAQFEMASQAWRARERNAVLHRGETAPTHERIDATLPQR